MSEVQLFLLAYSKNDKTEAREIAASTAKRLETKESGILNVVQELGPYLTEENVEIRSNAIAYLSTVLAALPSRFLSRQQTEVLATWYLSCIKDGPKLEYAAEGLQELLRTGRADDALVQSITSRLLDSIEDLQRSPQSDRYAVYVLVDYLLAVHRTSLVDIQEQVIPGVIDLVSGEKDPRNLMIIFSFMKVIMVEWQITQFAEPLYESVFCYFPITFRPPPNDPYKITAQDLKERLRACVAATGDFAPFAIPALIDKLDSTSPNVKKDVMQTISACALSYGSRVLSRYSIPLWDSLKYEIFNVQEENLADDALNALRSIATGLSFESNFGETKSYLGQYTAPITKECNQGIQDPQQKQAKAASRILATIAAAGENAYLMVIKDVMPPLYELYRTADSIAKQRGLLEVLVELLEANTRVWGTWAPQQPRSAVYNPLQPFKEKMLEVFSPALMGTSKGEVSFRIVALKGLLQMCRIFGFLDRDEIGLVVQYLNDVALEESTGEDRLQKEAIEALVQISKYKSDPILEISIPKFMAQLPQSADHGQMLTYVPSLEILAELSVEKTIFILIQRRLLSKLGDILNNGSSSEYALSILSTLRHIFSRPDLSQDLSLDLYFRMVIEEQTRDIVTANKPGCPVNARQSEAVIDAHGRLCNLIVRALPENKQAEVLNQVWSLFTTPDSFTPVPFSNQRSENERKTLVLSSHLLSGINTKKVKLDHITWGIESYFQDIVRLALDETLPGVRMALLRTLAVLTNKFFPTGAALPASIIDGPDSGLLPGNKTPNASRVAFWILKGLVFRMDTSITRILELLVSQLADAEYGQIIARGFDMLLSQDHALSEANHAIIRKLHKQKVFNVCTPRIATGFQAAPVSARANYLVALAGLLKDVPSEIIMPELETLLPLLLRSLDLDDPSVSAATLDTITVVAVQNAKGLEGHIASLVGRLLSCGEVKPSNPSTVRKSALRCLGLFPTRIRHEVLLPYKTQVMHRLLAMLDDPRRDVRKTAVDCRKEWAGMDEPDEDDE
ncbi:DNA repair and TFIIH regulator [Xylona heveae TC161]|uniref:MMS19 nucleotide excision repair protein n=1 Tax=Xylona heveae (strain CBS 132557 / TC161) TaxID=1328760 RepID=A0A165HPV8_XYLHT|nr:DNA repair and TFIIH regulator [Xylona heveae TC161]KZF23815.1 DNA repair and TFIIH regulator [Xylona heveae TC161]